MPLINGQKMACEPCIRGHRSTKCTHANERLMVPVRKPGRPLSSCPHPSSRACSCAAVTAAIPRKQKCRCGSAPTAAAENASHDKEPDMAPSSPSKAAAASGFRVQKAASKSAPSRKQSVDPNGLERMNSNQLNILTQYNSAPRAPSFSDGPCPSAPDMSIYGAMQLTPAECSFGSESTLFSPVFQFPLQPSSAGVGPIKPGANGGFSRGAVGSMASRVTPVVESCCTGSTSRVQAQTSAQLVQPPSPADNGSRADKPKGGCCSTTDKAKGAKSQTGSLPAAPSLGQQASSGAILSYQASMTVPNAVYPYYSQPTIYNYPPQFGSFLQPLQPEQWRQFMATINYGQSVAAAPGYGMNAPGSPSAHSSAVHSASGISWTSHQCSCGDSCQCVGCAAHPYNDATQDYVRSAWNTMMQDGQKLSNGTHTTAHLNGHGADGSAKDGNGRTTARTANDGTTHPDGTVSPPAPQTPSDGTSGINEEQTLSANDFFFVSYPFGDTCAGETASCPCGDDCQCIGCVIHHNPGPEQTDGNGSDNQHA
ncbi:hypothetical protein CDD82_5528 [Ophiocordyceps australis]|uniref:Copper-fist domain-containing protein n=1 Tax=Ophiocordyceps australis TaxID=1399860 RepID=A0A2C5Z0P5_9HYPO|nr:hypothetical protein CDD82_5528 [Ophiocordyceps australis]